MFKNIRKNPKELLNKTGLIGFIVLFAVAGVAALLLTRAETTLTVTGYPTEPPARICGNASILGGGPTTAPVGAIKVPAGDNSGMFFQFREPNQTFWFEPGVHTVGNNEFGQIEAGSNNTYIGAPGAIIDGQKLNRSAFSQQGANVRIAYLEIRNFVSPTDQGVVNHDSGRGWIIENNWVHHNKGAGVFLGTDNIMRNNCLADNGQYGFQALGNNTDQIPTNITVDRNEVTRNNADDLENKVNADGSVGCGCTGGAKFWLSNDARVTNNWIHDNLSAGLWFDNNNRKSLVEGNLIEGNFAEGIFIEAGYDARIVNNSLKRNAIGKGKSFANKGDTTFPVSAIYVSESGSPVGYDMKFQPTIISNNYLENNWNGVALWENPDRYSGSTGHTHISGTLKIGDLINDTKCKSGIPNDIPDDIDPYLCRWSTENVVVENNDFRIDKASIGTLCVGTDTCGVNSIFSQTGGFPEFGGYTIPWRITFQQGNIFRNNTYTGDWKFAGFERSKPGGARWTWADWTAPAPAVPATFTHDNRPQTFGQDAGSTYNGGSGGTNPSDTTKPTVSLTAPASGATLTNLATLTATASDDVEMSRVEFYAGVSRLGEDYSSPYSFGWNTCTVANGSYGVIAKAFDTAGNNASSAAANVTVNNTDCPAVSGPTTPKNFRVTSVTSTRVDFAWDASTNIVAPISGYELRRDGVPIGTTGGLTGADVSPVAGQTYSYTIESYSDGDSFRHSLPSAPLSVNISGGSTDTQPPTAPSALTATLGRSSSASLTWTASTDNVAVTKYYVVRNGTTIAELPGTTLAYNDTYLSPSTKYDYYLLASDAAGNVSPPSNTASVTTPDLADTTPPSAPTSLTATAASSTQVNLNWGASTDNVGINGYDVYRNNAKVATVATTSYGDTGLTASTSYSYHVIARDAGNNVSPNSNTASVTTPAAPVDPAAKGSISGVVSSSRGGVLAGARVKLTVNGSNYNYSTNSSGTYQVTNIPAGTYSVSYGAKHHKAQTAQVTVTSGTNTIKNITLQRR